ncbi:MAG: hypothetical protein RI907_2674 [Pseudomonadota bacterium]|jgi:hypothetical protein
MRLSWLASGLAALVVLASCGGGDTGVAYNTSGGDGVGSGGTGSYTSGTISGLGSIVVNGVRYDVSQARVTDDRPAGVTPYSADDLTIGMTVEVTAGTATPSTTPGGLPTASAAQVRFASALVGRVEVVPSSACSCLTVAGQLVRYSATTNMPLSLSASDRVEVFGRPDLSSRQLVASRIVVVTDARFDKLQGWVQASGLNTSAKTVSVYGPTNTPSSGAPLVLSYSSDTQVAALQNLGSHGRAVRVWFNADHVLQGAVVVDQPLVTDEEEARQSGLVTSAPDADGLMAVNGTWVRLASTIGSSTRAALAVGAHVLVEGRLVAGVLEVNEVHLGGVDGDDDEEENEIEVHGQPKNVVAIGSGQATMQVQHDQQLISVIFNLSVAPALSELRQMTCIEVGSQGYDGQGRLVATRVKEDSSCHNDD